MPSYKFQYFDVRGRGELSRYVFLAAGKDFTDERVVRDQWPSVKPSTPFGQMPVLIIDGSKKVAQSNTIARFLARELGLAGKDNFEQAMADQYIELVEDMFKELVKAFFEQDETKKKELQKNMQEVVLPKFLDLFEKALTSNGGKFFVGSGLTVADLAVYNAFDTPIQNNPALVDKYPNLKAQRAAIGAIPKIAAYIKTRKHSDI